MNIELLSLYHSLLMYLQDEIYAQQLELIKLRKGRDELSAQLLRMQAAQTANQSDSSTAYAALYDAAEGMTRGSDWNRGTHAKTYRPRLVSAVVAIREASKVTP